MDTLENVRNERKNGMNEEQWLEKRVEELAEKCRMRDIPTHTEFLNLNEQDIFYRTMRKQKGVRYVLAGGYPMAERKVGMFLPSYLEEGDESMLPVSCVHILPLNEKFADKLSHRDYLGALMNLGIERHKTGDIVADGTRAWLFCMTDLADYICENLGQVRHTRVYAEIGEVPAEVLQPEFETIEGSVASVRLDALLALAFKTSRSKMVPCLEAGQVFVNGRLVMSASEVPAEGAIVSVRHMGRFVYRGVKSETRKGRLFVTVDRYV